MNDIAGIPYFEAQFDKDGQLKGSPVRLPAGTTDLFVISHGWNNDETEARTLYRNFFESFAAVRRPVDLPAAKLAIVGVIWPSKKFDERLAISGSAPAAGGGASLGGANQKAAEKAVADRLAALKGFFTEPRQQKALDDAARLVPDLEDKATARREFADLLRSMLDPAAADKEDASRTFFREDGKELMDRLKIAPQDLGPRAAAGGASAVAPGGPVAGPHGGAAGLGDLVSGAFAGAMNLLNFTTYYEMKARAGTVGKNGVAQLIDGLATAVQRIHLVGHSFGGRVVTSAAAGSTTDKICSLTLLQTAFSHNGFSRSMKGFFRSVVDSKRVHGPILVTHTPNDKAVGVAYPLASRISGDSTAAFGDENDVFGGIGRNGTQKMEDGEARFGKLLPVGSDYQFQSGVFFNLEASDFIDDHGDVTGKEVAHALVRAIA